jgi:hypothetical protein
MGLGFSYRDQLLTLQDPARGFLVKQFDELCAALSSLSPLTDNLRLPYAKSGTLFTTSKGIPSLHQQVRCQAYDSVVAGQATTSGVYTSVNFDSEDFDVGEMHTTTAFPNRLTVPTGGDGTYLLFAVVPFQPVAGGQRILSFVRNETQLTPIVSVPSSGAALVTTVSHTLLVPAIAGDYFGVLVYQDSGGPVTIGDGTLFRVQFTAMKVAAA